MTTSQQVLFATSAGPAVFSRDAADFDGTTDDLIRFSTFSPAATDSKTGIFSVWYNPRNTTNQTICNLVNGGSSVLFFGWSSTTSKFSMALANAVGSSVIVISSTSTHASGSWHHILFSWDSAAATYNFYVNDVSDKTVTSGPSNTTIEWSGISQPEIGGNGGTAFANGGMAELYFAPSQFLDLSVTANRRKFNDGSTSPGAPVNLGTDGSTPTGTKPLMYHHLDLAEAATHFSTNRTGAGDIPAFSGTLTTFSSHP